MTALPVIGTQESCSCDQCVTSCFHKPGWFLPGEAELAAELLDMDLQEFFNEYLGVDWMGLSHDWDEDTFILAPSHRNMKAGNMYPAQPEGQCIFLTDDNRCRIHEAKPFQCFSFLHNEDTGDPPAGRPLNKYTAENWKDCQGQIKELLGREPKTKKGYVPPWGNLW